MEKADYRTLKLTNIEKLKFRTGALIAGLVTGWIFYNSLIAGMVAGIIICNAESRYREFLSEKRKNILLEQFRDMLYSVSSSVATGRSLGQALEESILFWQGTYDDSDFVIVEMKQMVREMKESNTSDIDVISDFGKRSGLEDVQDFAMVCKTCKITGANFKKAIDRASALIEDKINLERELHTATVQKKFEGRIVMIMPFLLLLIIKILSPAYLMPLYELPSGRLISTISLVLMAAGSAAIEGVNKIEI